MPNNRIIYWGIVVLVATVLLWIGAELTKRIEWALPYAGGIGVLMVVGGFSTNCGGTAPTNPNDAIRQPDADQSWLGEIIAALPALRV